MAPVRLFPLAILAVILTAGCGGSAPAPTKEAALTRKLTSEPWGKTAAGDAVELYTLTNAKGAEARITTYGGIVVSLKVPDRTGMMGDVVNGFDSLDGYLQQPPPPYFGALDRALRESHRQGEVYARWQGIHAGEERQRDQSSSRRAAGLRQDGLEGQGRRGTEPRADLSQQGRRGGLSRAT